jgi:hypothetical protein
MRAAGVAEVAGDAGRGRQELLVALVLRVEDPHGVPLETFLRVGRELISQRLEVGDEGLAVGGTARRIADRVQVQLELPEPQRVVPGGL